MTRESFKLSPEQLDELRADVASEFGNRVWTAIRLAKAKQGDVAEVLGWKQSYLSNVARGKYLEPSLGNARKLAELFGCSIEDLFPTRNSEAVAS